MKKLFTLSILAMMLSYASYALSPFVPSTGTVCIGSSLYLVDSLDPGGSWTSSNPSIATVSSVSSASAMLTGVSTGVVTVTYTLGSASVYGTFTVNPSPGTISGGTSPICVSSSTTLTSSTSGGYWTSGSSYVATVGSSTGVVTGAHAGTTSIMYHLGGCTVYKTVTVVATTTGSIVGPTSVCAGSTITLADSSGASGVWSSSNPSIATVGSSSGIVTGVAAGTVTISLTVTGACGTATLTRVITVSATTTPGTITGASSVMVGSTISLSATPSGGSWTSGSTSIATISSGGVVTGIATGTSVITYTITGCSGPASSYTTVTVTPFDGISGHVLFGSGSYWGNVKVWLITYNTSTHMLAANDSVTVSCSGTSAYYQFLSKPTDSYRVKAAITDTFFSGTGYIPTYHDNDFYWYNATVIPHVSGTADINKDINMATGTTTSGPGFIAGDVFTGANKGTSGSIPAENLHVCVVNATSGQIVQQTYTDAAGHYSFNNLPVGATYYVFPDSLNYLTTAYTSINLTTAAPSMSIAHFTMHTLSKTITPHTQGVNPLTPVSSSVAAFPNPANDKLFVKWEEKTAEVANIVITNITGRELYNSTVDMNEGTGIKTIDMSSFANGIYVITVKTATISYTNKLQVQH